MTRRRAPESVNRIRCEVCTRTSSEEGLEQEFNSLDAQREAGEAYIRSQAAGEARSPRRGAARGVAGTQSTGVPTAGVVPSPTNAARGTLSGCGATASRRHRASVCTLTPTASANSAAPPPPVRLRRSRAHARMVLPDHAPRKGMPGGVDSRTPTDVTFSDAARPARQRPHALRGREGRSTRETRPARVPRR